MIIVLKIRHSGEDYEVFLCKTHEVAERLIREWFAGYNIQNCIEAHIVIETGRTVPTPVSYTHLRAHET